ncbi:MAG: fumarylacetoacetate hydrolase family protein [Rhodobacteraceae bacterium]|nr:fumarylacetoacetate hydrolase family protein [Paracoccaceae bacterium]
MKFVRFGAPGSERPGVLDDEGRIRSLAGVMDDVAGEALSRLGDINPSDLPVVEGDPRIGPCVGGVGKFIAIGLNFSDHAEEAGMEPPSEPIVFMKATSSICGPNDGITIPRGSEKTDWEVELGVVIGKTAKYLSADECLDCIAGFCIVNDVSERAYQLERGGQWTKGKSCDSFGPVGPWLVTPDEVGNPQNLDMELKVNGEVMQTGNTSKMIFEVGHILSYLSQMMTLHPGDIIATGTPPGVGMGMKPPQFLAAGDVVELSIDKLGTQRQDVTAD